MATELSQDLVIPAYSDKELTVRKVEKGLPISELGCTKFAMDKFTLSSDRDVGSSSYYKYEAKHSLGVKPKYAMLHTDRIGKINNRYYVTDGAVISVPGAGFGYGTWILRNTTGNNSTHTPITIPMTDTAITINAGSGNGSHLAGGVEYTLITMA